METGRPQPSHSSGAGQYHETDTWHGPVLYAGGLSAKQVIFLQAKRLPQDKVIHFVAIFPHDNKKNGARSDPFQSLPRYLPHLFELPY